MDIERYSKAFDSFLNKIPKVTDPFSKEHQEILEEVCELLRIGKIEVTYYENPRKEKMHEGDFVLLYDGSKSEESCILEKRTMSSTGAIINLRIYMKEDAKVWSEMEQEKADIFASMLCAFNGHAWLERLAEKIIYYDRSLGIPNVSYIHREIAKFRAMGQLDQYATGFMNIKRFTAINQKLGRENGTKVMELFITNLQTILGSKGTVARAGGDNFVLLFKKECLDIIKKYVAGTEIFYGSDEGYGVIVKANIGVYLIDGTEDIRTDFIENAHIAAQQARASAEKNYVIYDDKLKASNESANNIEGFFREGLSNEEFQVYYQPKVKLNNYKIAGAEALCRWFHDGKMIPPNEFIPVLEQSNAICMLDFYMLEHVCRDIRRWLDQGLEVVRVSVNLSRQHMGDTKLVDKLIKIIDKYQVPHAFIEIELTETTTDVEFNDLQEVVVGLHENGLHTSVDDFGVGYSALNLIRQIPWDVIKIDKSLLPDRADESAAQYILFSHLLSMFRDMGISCIVEGVETIEQVKMLKENKCMMAQGFFFDRPLPVEEFEIRLKEL